MESGHRQFDNIANIHKICYCINNMARLASRSLESSNRQADGDKVLSPRWRERRNRLVGALALGTTIIGVGAGSPVLEEAIKGGHPTQVSVAKLNGEQRRVLDDEANWSARRLMDPAVSRVTERHIEVEDSNLVVSGKELLRSSKHYDRGYSHRGKVGSSEIRIAFAGAPKDISPTSVDAFLDKAPHVTQINVKRDGFMTNDYDASAVIKQEGKGAAVLLEVPEDEGYLFREAERNFYEMPPVKQIGVLALGLRPDLGLGELGGDGADGFVSDLREAHQRYGVPVEIAVDTLPSTDG